MLNHEVWEIFESEYFDTDKGFWSEKLTQNKNFDILSMLALVVKTTSYINEKTVTNIKLEFNDQKKIIKSNKDEISKTTNFMEYANKLLSENPKINEEFLNNNNDEDIDITITDKKEFDGTVNLVYDGNFWYLKVKKIKISEINFYELLKVFKFTLDEHFYQNYEDVSSKEVKIKTFAQRFYEIVKKGGNKIAIVDEENSVKLSYEELWDKSSVLVNNISEKVKKQQIKVALCIEKSWKYLLAVLAVQRIGGTCVLMDISQPINRLLSFLDDVDPDLVLTSNKVSDIIPNNKFITLDVEKKWDSKLLNQPSFPSINFDEKSSFIAGTSGTTGKPKAACLSYKGMSVTLDSIIKTASLNMGSIGTWFSSPGYGMIEVDCLPVLSAGGTIKIYPQKLSKDVTSIINWMNEQRINHTLVMTSIAEAIWETPIKTRLSTMIIAGEKCKKWPPDNIFYSVFNVYGAAEAAVVSIENLSTYRNMKTLPTVGHPIEGANAYIVNEKGTPLPRGCIGELVVTGETLSLGYVNPKDTKKSFDINNLDDSSRLKYNTGDRARIKLNGKIEILGRIDSLVKVRGHRVDLSEIEIKVLEIKGVKKVAAVLLNEKIVLFVESNRTDNEFLNSIRKHIKKYLPGYFEPTHIEFKKLPLTNNQKVDYKKLKNYKFDKGQKRIKISSQIEFYLKNKWEKWTNSCLRNKNSNFFYDGGDSLSAMRLIGELSYEKGIKIKMNEFLEDPTFFSFVNLVENSQKNELPSFELTNKVDKYKPFQLNESQQALWIGRGMDFNYGGVGCQGYFEWKVDKIDVKKLSDSINHLINRHDMLRMVINNRGKQEIIKTLTKPYELEFNDFSKENLEFKKNKINRIRNKMSNEEIGFSNWPLFKFSLSKIDSSEYRLHFCIDMLIADAWSIFQVLIPDLIDIYSGREQYLPEIKTSFKDYVLYRESLKKTNQYLESKKYWLDKVTNLPPAPKLPMVDKKKINGHHQFKRFEGVLEKSKWDALKISGQEKEISPSGIIALILCEVLRFWNESNDFTLNFPVSDRLPVSDDIDNIVGDFTNTLLVPYSVGKNLKLEDKGSILQKEIWEALDNRLFTGVEVLRELSRRNKNGKEPLMPVVLTSLLGHPKRRDASLLGKEVYGVSQTPQVTLDVQIRESEGDLIFKWDYLKNAIQPVVVEDMFKTFSKLLNNLCDNPSIWKKRSLDLLPSYQKKQRETINSTESILPNIALRDLLLNKLKEKPNETFLIYKNNSYTLKEIIDESKKVSNLINKYRSAEKEFVGILLPKSVYQYQAVYGCLISNTGYVPIDIDLPLERIKKIIEKGNIKTIITSKEVTLLIEGLNKIEIECLENTEDKKIGIKTKPIDYSPYVIFTSGSTGNPKGVEISEESVINHIYDVVKRFNLDSETCHLATASLNFDMSVFDVFGPLLHGGKVVIPEHKNGPDIETWVNLQKKHNVNFWACVPAIMELVCYIAESRRNFKNITSMKNIVMAGDWIPLDLLPKVRKIYPNSDLYSCGGPTETTNWSIIHKITKNEGEICNSVIYGVPMANSKYHIMNHDLEHCPNWVVGEMIVESEISLARGYLDEKNLTNYFFFIEPKSKKRMYRTGDLGRYLPNGEIEILGRIDNQIKIKGLRIELSEIEKLALELSDVEKAIALALKDKNGKNKNIAMVYIGNYCSEKLLEKLKKNLPDYMIPSLIKRLPNFPLSNNGKIDIKRIRNDLTSEEKKTNNNEHNNILKMVIKIISETLKDVVVLPEDRYLELDENLEYYNVIKEKIDKEFNLTSNHMLFDTEDTVENLSKKIKEANK